MEETRKLRAASRVKLCYHERKLKELQTHLERGTTPKTLRLKPYPKMKTPQGQALIHEACDEVQKIMLIQMVEEEQQALAQAQKEGLAGLAFSGLKTSVENDIFYSETA